MNHVLTFFENFLSINACIAVTIQIRRIVRGRISGIGGEVVGSAVVMVVGVAVGWVGSAPVIWMRFEFRVCVKSSW